MTNLRKLFRGLGGPDILSWPAFVLTWVLAMFGHLATGTIKAPLIEILVIVTAAQCLAFIPLIGLRITFLKSYENSHPWIGLFGILVAGVIRGSAISALLELLDSESNPLWAYRIVAALSSFSLVLVICVMSIHSYRERKRALQDLMRLNDDLLATNLRAREQVTSRNEDVVIQIREVLEQEFLEVFQSSDQEFRQSLQRLAADVVRPLSHDLEQSLPAWHPENREAPSRPSWRQVMQGLSTGKPIRPGMATAFVGLLLLILGARFFPSHLLAVLFIFSPVMWGLFSLGNKILERCINPSRLGRSVALLILVVSASCVIALWLATMPLGDISTHIRLLTFGSLVAIIDALLVSFWYALRAEQERLQIQLDSSAASLRRELALLHQADRLHTKALARALHGPVQMTATAAALKFDDATVAGALSEDLRRDLEQALREALDLVDSHAETALPFEEALKRITSLWEGVCDVIAEISVEARQVLSQDPAVRAAVVEILTDAVSNAVRHGKAKHINAELRYEGDLLLTVTDDGTVAPMPEVTGLGTKVLDECAIEWSREQLSYGHRLTAVIPVTPRF